MRLLVSPLAVIAQKNMVLLNNNSPKMQEIQNRMTEARQRGDMLESAKVGSELQSFMKTRGINPLKNMLPIMAQAPIFMAMFLGIRGMANLPLESMLTGGILWFKDLTIPDQYYLMPLFISTTTFLQFHLGADGAMMTGKSPLIKVMKYGIPVIMLAFTVNFPSVWFCFQFVTNAWWLSKYFFTGYHILLVLEQSDFGDSSKVNSYQTLSKKVWNPRFRNQREESLRSKEGV